MWSVALLRVRVAPETLADALAHALGLRGEEVFVYMTGTDIRGSERHHLRVEVHEARGDFETGIELLADPDIAKRIDLEVLRRMCMRMKVGLWVDDPDSYDPELGFYCSASGRISRLSIWEDDGDDDDVMPTWMEVGDWE